MGEHPAGMLVAASALMVVGLSWMVVSARECRKSALVRAVARTCALPGPQGHGLRPPLPVMPFGPIRAELTTSDGEATRAYVDLRPREFEGAGFQRLGFPARDEFRAGPGRWESHQDFEAYMRVHRPEPFRFPRVLLLRPVGPWPERYQRFMPALLRFAAIYFQRPARWGANVPLDASMATRVMPFGARGVRVQFGTAPILHRLKESTQRNSMAVLGVTVHDLHPGDESEFVFGQALIREGLGVLSLARLFMESPYTLWTGAHTLTALKRAFKVLGHEMGHMLGLRHCIAYRCGMNGCSSLAELDRNPLQFCPLCMAKLAWRLELDLKRRYRALSDFLSLWQMEEPARWYERHAERMNRLGGRIRTAAEAHRG